MGLDNPLHIAFLLVILLLVFGAKRLPEMGRSLGEGLRGFKDSMSGDASRRSIVATERGEHASTVRQAIAAAPAAVPESAKVAAAARTLGAQHREIARDGELAAH